MASKLTASYNRPAESKAAQDRGGLSSAANQASTVTHDTTEETLSGQMHECFAGVLAHLLYKHYAVENIEIGAYCDPAEDHNGEVKILFGDNIALPGKQRLDILEKLSVFLSDLQDVTQTFNGIEIEPGNNDDIFTLSYHPAAMGAALGLLVEKFAPSDQNMGQGLHDASILLERVANYTPRAQMN